MRQVFRLKYGDFGSGNCDSSAENETAPKIISYDAMGNVLVEQQVTVPVMGYPVAMDMSDDGKMLAVTYFIQTTPC